MARERPPLTVTLIGGTGFVGRALAARFVQHGASVRSVARHAARPAALPSQTVEIVGDVGEPAVIEHATAGADLVIYLPGRAQARRLADFRRVHVDGARACAEAAWRAGVARFVFVSALGVRRDAPAMSDRTKAEGEAAALEAHADALIIRPSLVLGPGDHVTRPMADIMRRMPVMPVVGGATRIQPVHVDDLADGIAAATALPSLPDRIVEAAGPARCTMHALLERIRDVTGQRCRLLPLPESVALLLAMFTERLPGTPLVRDQVRLMATDKTETGRHPTLRDLGIRLQQPLDTLADFL